MRRLRTSLKAPCAVHHQPGKQREEFKIPKQNVRGPIQRLPKQNNDKKHPKQFEIQGNNFRLGGIPFVLQQANLRRVLRRTANIRPSSSSPLVARVQTLHLQPGTA